MRSVIRTVIADDEPLARNKLRLLLSAEAGIEVVEECRNGAETIAAVHARKPDLLFLDIQMPDASGFEVLGRISPEEMPVTIFTTAYDQFAIRAFEARALDYSIRSGCITRSNGRGPNFSSPTIATLRTEFWTHWPRAGNPPTAAWSSKREGVSYSSTSMRSTGWKRPRTM
jgi:CheY-like chemotaxis protein